MYNYGSTALGTPYLRDADRSFESSQYIDSQYSMIENPASISKEIAVNEPILLDPIQLFSAYEFQGPSLVWGWDYGAFSNWFLTHPSPGGDPGSEMLDYAMGEKPIIDTFNDLVGQTAQVILATLRGYAVADTISDYGDVAILGIPDVAPETYDSTSRVFSGNSTTPVAAMAHYIMGNGETMQVDIQNAIPYLNFDSIAPIADLAENSAVGTTPVSSNFAYDTFETSIIDGAYLGHVTLHIEGTFIKTSTDEWSFSGSITGFNDVYDANPSNHRGPVAEAATWLLGSFAGTPYEIELTNNIPLEINNNTGDYVYW